MRVAGCLHVTKETAVLIETIRAAGAELSWSGCNPLSTQDDVAAWLAEEGYSIHAWHGQSVEDFYWCIDKTLEFKPTLTLDDGADLIVRVHGEKSEYAETVIGYHDGKKVHFFKGRINGAIANKPKGKGFGWDPIFIPNNDKKTFAQMSSEDKNQISMRAKAFKKFAKHF